MGLPVLRTLSARIVLGFAILILMFAVVMAITGGNMYILTKQVRVIPAGYLQLALIGKDMVEKQKVLRDYIGDEIEEEASARRAAQRIRRLRNQRARLLRDARKTVVGLADVPASHRKRVRHTAGSLDEIDRRLDELEGHYQLLLARPPLRRIIEREGMNDELRASVEAQRTIRRLEGLLYSKIYEFAQEQEQLVTGVAVGVARNERKARRIAFALAAAAVVVSLMLMIWVILNLRPLRRLQQAARRIARGDYGSRIEEKGPSEVADLAHEFNLMGRAIEERERELVRSERLAAVGKMAAMITHEVRNPLSSIGLNTELLEEELADLSGDEAGEARNLCRSITTEVDRLTEITEEYLKFARLPKPKLRRESLVPVIDNLVEFERESMRQRNVEVTTELERALPDVMIDDAQLRQALLNLLRNAAEALEEDRGHGAITVSAARDGDAVTIEVADDGPGIPRELADKLFDPFVSTKERGTGLGLAMTHQIVREHGGLMSVDSAPGAGTRFVIKLPAAPPV